MKKIPKKHKGRRMKIWYAHRLEGKVKNIGIKPAKKKKKETKPFPRLKKFSFSRKSRAAKKKNEV
ncbi:MAG: hypothetical protein AAB355_03560 [Patescibacteria group bacterium]